MNPHPKARAVPYNLGELRQVASPATSFRRGHGTHLPTDSRSCKWLVRCGSWLERIRSWKHERAEFVVGSTMWFPTVGALSQRYRGGATRVLSAFEYGHPYGIAQYRIEGQSEARAVNELRVAAQRQRLDHVAAQVRRCVSERSRAQRDRDGVQQERRSSDGRDLGFGIDAACRFVVAAE